MPLLIPPVIRILVYLALSLAFLIPGTVTLPLMDRDEPRFAQATWEMMETHQWTVPYFNGEYRFDKPPLTYWWMRINYWIFGKSEIGARLHSVLAAWLAAVVICRLGRFLYSDRAGFLAGLGFLTCLQVLVHGRLCVADMPMILAVIAVMDASTRLIFSEEQPKRFGKNFWYLTVALAFGFLAKGPIAWVVPILTWLLYRWVFARQRTPFKNLQPFWAFGISLGIVALWGLPAMIETNWDFLKVGIGEHVVNRGLEPLNGRSSVPGLFYLGTVLLSLLPWGAFLPFAVMHREVFSDPKQGLLMAWFLSPFLIFSFYATQLPHYILPGFAGFFLLLFRRGELPFQQRPMDRVFFWIHTGMFAVITGVIFIWLPGNDFPPPFDQITPLIWLAGGLITLIGGAIPLGIRFSKLHPHLPGICLAVAIPGAGIFAHSLSTQIRKITISVQLAERFFADQPAEKTKFAAYEFTEPSLVYYQNSRHGWKFSSNLESSHKWLNLPGPRRVMVFRTRVWNLAKVLLSKNSEPAVDEREAVRAGIDFSKYRVEVFQGFNAARTTWEEVLVALPRYP